MSLTVAVGSYNHERYVEECLSSIVEQKVRDIELVWIDDHSTDGTFSVVERALASRTVAKRFSRIFVHRNTVNRGAAYSLNLAARAGHGRLISFMNSDDWYMSTRLERLSALYDGRDHWLGFSGVLTVDRLGSAHVADNTAQDIVIQFPELIERFGSVSKALMYRNVVASTGNIIVSRPLYERLGGFKHLAYCHDWMFTLGACLYCEPTYVPERLYAYRLHATNSYKSLKDIAEKEWLEVVRWFFREMALHEPNNPSLPSFRERPAEFYALLQEIGLHEVFMRVLHPYSSQTRMLDLQMVRRDTSVLLESQ